MTAPRTPELSQAILLAPESPFPSTSGGRQRDAQVLNALREVFEVEVLCLESDAGPSPVVRDWAEREGIRITELQRDRGPLWRRMLGLVQPPVFQDYCHSVAEALKQRAAPGRVLWVSRLAMAQYIPLARSLGYRVILDEHNVESTILMRAALSSMKHWHESVLAAQCKYYEEHYCEASDAVVATSDLDASRLHRLAPKAPVHVIPNSVESQRYEHLRENPGNTIFFSGAMNYLPNVEGMTWFIFEVMPRLRAALGKQMPRVVVSGAPPSDEVGARLAQAGIEMHTQYQSHLALLGDAAVVIAPIRSGGGNRLKILEAMAAGRAVVTTGKGAEGLVLAPAHDILMADQADAFTSAIVKLLRDPELRLRIGRNAVKTIEERYDWSCAKPLIERLLATLDRPGANAEVRND